jgi:hypothetical protein
MANQKLTPGTVSKILWHFTGGPMWDSKKNKQGTQLKTDDLAYDNLKNILSSKELRLGGYQEIVKVTYPERRLYLGKGKWKTKKNVSRTLKSSSVCCLADIPIQHLRYHAIRYGNFAIGYYRESAIKSGFNPVFYSLETTDVVKNIYEGFSSLEYTDASEIRDVCSAIESETCGFESDGEELDISNELENIEYCASDLESSMMEAASSLENFLAFVKTFNKNEFDSIYCEREWRSLSSFNFSYEDVALLVLPKSANGNNYVSKLIKEMRIPRKIPIMSWEDLVCH